MSANDHTTAPEEAHTGPIKTPQQLLAAVFFSFIVPIFAIIGLVYYVTSANKPAAGSDDSERAVAERIQKVGMVEIRDACTRRWSVKALWQPKAAVILATWKLVARWFT